MFRTIFAALGAAVLALGLTAVAVAAPASATHPGVVGTAVCNTTTGTFDIIWRVSGDTSYKNETATISTAAITSSLTGEAPGTTTSLIGKTVKNLAYVEAVQQGATVGAQYQLTVQVQWTNHSTGDLVSKSSNVVTPTGSCAIPPKDSVDCSAITFGKGSPLDGSNYINATFIQNGAQFQMNAEINEVQAGDPASPSGFYVLVHAPTGDVKYPLTITERDSGIFTFHYSDYLTNQWTVHWIQYDGHNDHYTGDLVCGNSVKPTVGYELGTCYQNGTAPNLFSSSNLTLVFDNSASTVPVTFTVPNGLDVKSSVTPTPSIVRTVPPGQIVKVETTPISNGGGAYVVVMNGVGAVTIPNATITIPPFTGCLQGKPGDPSHSNETCVAGSKVLGSITVGLETGLVYSIDGPKTHISPVVAKTTTGLAADDYVVSVLAAPGYTLTGADTWPLTVTIAPATCGQLVTLAYTGVSSSLRLILAGGLAFIGFGGLLIARRRWVSRG